MELPAMGARIQQLGCGRRCVKPLGRPLLLTRLPVRPALRQRPQLGSEAQHAAGRQHAVGRIIGGHRLSDSFTTKAVRSSNVIEAAIREELALESTRIPTDVRERVEKAIQRNRYKATAGEIAAQAGVTLTEAETALKALAYDSQAVLQVSAEGDVVYCFQPGFQSSIRNKSVSLRAKPFLDKAQSFALQLVRVTFGATLLGSIVITLLAISIVLRSSDRNDNRNSSSSRGYSSGYSSFNMMNLPLDLWLRWTPRNVSQDREEMNFFEAIFSFVFGDGNPNEKYDEERWRALGRLIQSQDGVVTAEEMAPYLEPSSRQISGEASTSGSTDESYVLPCLIKFGGEPFVDEQGQLLYRFPSLQKAVQQREYVGRRGAARRAEDDMQAAAYERPWKMTAASLGQQLGVISLGVFNVVGVFTLGQLLLDPNTQAALLREGAGWIVAVLPFLSTYATAFFGIPALRFVRNALLNRGIEARNDAREAAVRRLARPAPELTRKLASARAQGQRTLITGRDIVFTTEQDTGTQANASELDDFDRRLAKGRSAPGKSVQDARPRGSTKEVEREVMEETHGW